MIALDTNILIGLLVSSSEFHEEATKGMELVEDHLCTTPTNIGEVLRLLTHPRVFSIPLKVGPAVDLLSDFLEAYQVRVLDEDPEWWRSLPLLAKDVSGLKGNEVFDARIALCLKTHRVKRIWTKDSDFKKFSFLQSIKLMRT